MMRDGPRMPMPSSSGPTLAPSPPSLWQTAQFLVNTCLPRARSGLALFEAGQAVLDQVAKLFVARGQAGGELRDLVVEFVDFLLGELSRRQAALATIAARLCRRRWPPSSASPPGLLLASDAAISTARRSGAVGRNASRHSRAASLLTVPSGTGRTLAERHFLLLIRQDLVEHLDRSGAVDRDAGHDGVDPNVGADIGEGDLGDAGVGRREASFPGPVRCPAGGRCRFSMPTVSVANSLAPFDDRIGQGHAALLGGAVQAEQQ